MLRTFLRYLPLMLAVMIGRKIAELGWTNWYDAENHWVEWVGAFTGGVLYVTAVSTYVRIRRRFRLAANIQGPKLEEDR